MKIRLVVISGPSKGAIYPLRQGDNILGRSKNLLISLDHPQVSSEHCVISLDGSHIFIADKSSSNGTFINGTLIKKLKLKGNEKISVGPFTFMLAAEKGSQFIQSTDKSTEMDEAQVSHAPVEVKSKSEKALYKKIFNKFNEIVLPVLYDFNKKNEWWTIVLILFISYVILNIGLSIYPIIETAKESVVREAEKRAYYITKQIAEINQEYVANKQEQYLNVDFAEVDRSVEEAVIVDLSGRIIAPGSRLNEISSNSFIVKALRAIKTGNQKHWVRKKQRNHEGTKVIVSVPIFVRSAKSGLNTPQAIAVVKFSLIGIALDIGTIGVIYFEALITAIILGLICIYLINRLTYKAISSVNDDIDKVLRGMEASIPNTYKFEPLNRLIESINSSLSRIPNLSSGTDKKSTRATDNEQQIIESMLLAIENLVLNTNTPMMLLNASSEIISISPSFEELSGIHLATSQNQKITEAARDDAFAAMMEDMIQQAPERDLGGVTEEYEFPSGAYSITCSSIDSLPGKAEAFLVSVEINKEETGEDYV